MYASVLCTGPRRLARRSTATDPPSTQGHLPNLLGLRSGDTLLAVNGSELDSMDRAMGLYVKLRRASNLSVLVERKGKVFEKQISIR